MGTKKLIAVLLIVCMMLGIMPTVFSAGIEKFVDFPTGWSREAMTAAVQNGLIQGVSENQIKPEDNLTRAEFATIITRAFGAETVADISNFTDVSPSAWYYDYIAKAVKMEVLNGKSSSEMDPDAFITREEVFTALARVLVLSSDDSSSLNRFNDKASISDWAVSSLSVMSARGYVNGDDTGNLNPKANITREEFAQVMYNTIKRYITTTGVYGGNLEGITVVRAGNVTLRDAVVSGDLVIGDGAGVGSVVIENTTIQGRLLVRGGTMTLKNFKIGEDLVVVKNVNGVTNFNNYRSEFKNVTELTTAKFLSQGGSIGGGPTGPGGTLSHTITIIGPSGTPQVISVPRGQVPNLSSYVIPNGYTHSGQFYLDPAKTRPYVPSSANSSFALYPDLTPIPYTITYVLPTGTLDGTQVTSYTVESNNITLPTASNITVPTGHRFEGWYDNPSYTGLPVTVIPTGTYGNKTYYAKIGHEGVVVYFKLKSTDLTYYYTSPSMVTGSSLGGNMPADPNPLTDIPGYTFGGWYIDGDFADESKRIDSTTRFTADTTVCAKLTPIPYTITYSVPHATLDGTETVSYTVEDAVTLPLASNLTLDAGYEFKGWYDNSSFTGTPVTSFAAGQTGNKEYYALVEAINYTLTYVVPAGSSLKPTVPTTFTVESGVTLPVALDFAVIPAGFEFKGWYDNDSYTGTPVTIINAGEVNNRTYYAKIAPISYTITYNISNATLDGTEITEYTASDAVILPTASGMTLNTGYEFKGWYDNPSFTGTPVTGFNAGQTGNKEYYARVETIEYSIAYSLPTGSYLDGTQTIKYTVLDTVTLPVASTVTVPSGYEFKGWFEDVSYQGTPLTAIPAGTTGNKTYYGLVESIQYGITYVLPAGTTLDGTETTTYTINNAVTLPTASALSMPAGYVFGGWYLNDQYTGAVITGFASGETGHKTYYAKVVKDSYTITYNLPANTTIGGSYTTTYTVTDAVTLPTVSNLTFPLGYEFKGWFDNASFTGTAITGFAAGETGNKEYYACVEAIEYDIIYDLPTGTTLDGTQTEKYTVNDAVTLPTASAVNVPLGYEFKGWYDNASFTGTAVTGFNAGETGAKEYYALVEIVEYSITYDLPTGTTLDGTQTLKYTVNDTVALPTPSAVSVPLGYEFKGWFENGNKVETIVQGTTGNKVYTAKVEVITYSITYTLDTGATLTGSATTTYNVTQSVTLPLESAITVDLGYEYEGWFAEDTYQTPITSIPVGSTGDKVIYGKVTPIPYSITYVLPQGITFIQPEDIDDEYTVEEYVTLPTGGTMAIPVGYKFDGWYDNPQDAGIVIQLTMLLAEPEATTHIPQGTTGHKIFYAKITPVDYTITYNLPAGSSLDGSETTGYTIEEAVTLPVTTAVSVPNGYEFMGWYDNASYTGSKVTGFAIGNYGNKEYFGKVTPIEYDIEYVLPQGTTLDGTQTKKYTIEQSVALPTEANVKPLAGYKFDGWYDNAEFQGTPVTSFDAGETGKKTFYALISTIDYTISYEFGTTGAEFKDGVTPDTEYIVTDTVSLPVKDDIKVPAGKKFAGWYYNSALTDGPVEEFTGKVPATGTVLKLYARVIPEDQYTVFFRKELTDTENYAMPVIYSGTSLGADMPQDPEKEGHTFDGWYIDGLFDDETKKVDATTVFIEDTYVYAKWKTNLYTVNFIKGETIHKTLTDIPYNTVLSDESYWQGLPDAPEETIYTKFSKYSEFVYPYDEPFKIADVYYYEKEDGTWARFDNTVAVTHDIDAYLMDKRFSIMVKIPSRSGAFGPDTPYVPGETRMMDTLKAILANGANTLNILEETEIFKKVEDKATQVLVDKDIIVKHDNGDLEIKITELPINITRIVDGQRARQTVKQYVEDVINDPDKLDSMLDMIDINDLVDQIGASTLISKLSDKQIVDMMKDPLNKTTVENGIYSAIGSSDVQGIIISYLKDALVSDEALCDEIATEFKTQLSSDGTLRAQILGDAALLESVLGQANIKAIVADVILSDDVLEIAVTDATFKATLIEKMVTNEDIRNKVSGAALFKDYVLTKVKTDGSLVAKIREKLATDYDLRDTLITDATLLDSLLGDSTLNNLIISSAIDSNVFIEKVLSDSTLKDYFIDAVSGNQTFIDLLIETEEFADFIIEDLHTSNMKSHILAMLDKPSVKVDIHETLKDNDAFRAELLDPTLKPQILAAMGNFVGDADVDDILNYVWHRTLGETYTGSRADDFENFITDAIVAEFKAILYDNRPGEAAGMTEEEFFDELTTSQDARDEVKTQAEAEVRDRIDEEIEGYKESILNEFVSTGMITNSDGTENLDIEDEIDIQIISIVKDFINYETTGNDVADDIIEHEVVEYVKSCVRGGGNPEVAEIVEEIKDDFMDKIDTIPVDVLVTSIATFRGQSADNKQILVNAALAHYSEIANYIKTKILSDNPDDDLKSTVNSTLANVAPNLSDTLIQGLIDKIGDGADAITTVVSDYIGGLDDDELKAEINTFVDETSDADILDMIQELRDDTTLDLKGTIQGDNIYGEIKGYLVDNIGDGTIYSKVDNVLATQAGNIDNDVISTLIVNLLNSADDENGTDNSTLVTDYLAGYVADSNNETKVRGYIGKFLASDTLDEAFIKENRATIESVINSVDISGMITNDLIKTYVGKLEGDDKANFINDVYEAVLELDYFKEFIAVFDSKGESFEVNKDNLAFVKAIADGIDGFTYDSIISYISFKGFDKIEEILGDRFLEPIFNKAKEDYVDGLYDAIEEVEADDTKVVNYTTSMVFKLDIINDVLVKLYDEAIDKAVTKLYNVESLRYDQNDYLYSLIEYNNLIDEMFENANRADGDPLNETLTGWKLRTPTEYYDIALGKVILLDDAICWYGDNITEDQIDAIFSAVINKGFAVHDRLNGIINDYDLYHSFPEPVQKVINKVSQINSFITKYQSQIDSVVDAYLNSGLNQKFESSVITEKDSFEKAVDIIFGTEEHPVFNIDSIYFLLEKAADSEFRAKLYQKLINGEPRITAALDRFQNTDFGRLLDGVGNSKVTSMADKASEFASSGKITSAYERIYDVVLHILDPNIGPDAFKFTVNDPSIKAAEDAYRISIKGIEFKFMRYYK